MACWAGGFGEASRAFDDFLGLAIVGHFMQLQLRLVQVRKANSPIWA
jgi:hypothetical protein